MILDKLHYLSKVQSWNLTLGLIISVQLYCLRFVPLILILGKNVSPKFLVFAHELIDGISVTVLFLVQVYVSNRLILQASGNLVVLVVLRVGTRCKIDDFRWLVGNTKLLLSLLNLILESSLLASRCKSELVLLGLPLFGHFQLGFADLLNLVLGSLSCQ